MIDREKALAILKSLDGESLCKALEANGIKLDRQGGDGDVLGGLAAKDDDNKITPWGDRTIKIKGEDTRPSLVDKEYLQPEERAQEDAKKLETPYLDDGYDASLDPYMHPAG